jgi:hypothetical protein
LPRGLLGGNDLLETAFPVGSDGVRRVDEDLPSQSAAMIGDELLDCVEVDRKDDDVGPADRVRDWRGFGVPAELAREHFGFGQRLIRNNDLLAAGSQILCQGGANVSEADDCDVHGESFPFSVEAKQTGGFSRVHLATIAAVQKSPTLFPNLPG